MIRITETPKSRTRTEIAVIIIAAYTSEISLFRLIYTHYDYATRSNKHWRVDE